MIGTTLGHYRILAKLGQGGMGEVFEAEDERLKRRVALKLLSPGLAEGVEERERFQREAETIASLNHPNIVTLFSVEQEEGRQFLTMEKVEGEGLDRVLRPGGLPLARIFEIAIPIADALSAAHARDVVHRDLKPANVMINDEGRVKILDFGLAKLAPEPGPGTDEATAALTQEGMVLGTVPYMSPEQVQGKPVDRRTDIFSLGVILYELATGERPFSGDNSAALISSILRDQPPAVSELDNQLPHHLGRIIRHCLEKDPARRYQSALDVRNELEDLRKEIDSGVVHSETLIASEATAATAGRRARPRWQSALVLVLALGAVGLAGWRGWRALRPMPESAQPVGSAGAAGDRAGAPSSIAVLFFDNLSGDPELEWLRSGLTDMLVTDLSQSPELRVLSTDRVYQILSDLEKLDERITSFEVVREVASRANADTVILGSFAKLGDTIQISIKIQEAATGEILQADSVRANAQEEIFARVDDLSRSIRRSIELPAEPVTVADRGVAEVTTDSVEAYRYFVEAEKLHYQTKDQEAIELYRKAVELDPEFALAWAKLGTAHSNIGRQQEATQFTQKAIEHLDRLTEPERAYVEGRYFGRSLSTINRALETYTETLERYPHLTALANNLGIAYNSLWMYDEAIAVLEQGISYGDDFPGTYNALASAYLSAGRAQKAIELLEGYLEEHPDLFSTYSALAQVHGSLGNLAAAKAALDRADELRPGDLGTLFGRFAYAVTTDDFEAAKPEIEKLESFPFPFAKSGALGLRTVLAMYEGRAAKAMELGEEAVASWPGPGPGRGQSRLGLASGYLELGQPQKALEHLSAAREDDRGNLADFVGHGLQALAFQGLGQERRADLALDEFSQRVRAIPGHVFRSLEHELRGHLAAARGDHALAIREFEKAEALLPDFDGDSARLWFALAEAYLATGREKDAERMFERIRSSRRERAFRPVEYVSSHYQLGRIHERRGDLATARGLYQTFVDYWRDGDLARQEIGHAESFLAARGTS